MPSRRFAAAAFLLTVALGACGGHDQNLNKPDPNAYLLRFQPESLVQNVGASGTVAMHAKLSSGEDVPIRVVEWSVADGTIASLSGSTVSTEGTLYATVIVTCDKAGQTTVGGNAIVGYELRLSEKLPVTCTAPPPGTASLR